MNPVDDRETPSLDFGDSSAARSPHSAWTELDRRDRGTRFIGIQARSIVNSAAATHMTFWSVNPYIGCEFGCRYCYARDTHRWAVERAVATGESPAIAHEMSTLDPSHAFERRILVKENAAALLLRSFDPRRLDGEPLVIGTATDPYQPGERRFRVTRSLLEALRGYPRVRLGIITKSPLILRDLELLVELAQQREITINLSLAAIDPHLLRHLEPRSPTPRVRLRAMQRMTRAGLRVGLLIAPVLPAINDGRPGLHALIAAARDCGAAWVAAAPLRLGAATRRTLLPWLAREHPDLARRYHAHYGSGQGVSRAYDEALHRRLAEIQHELGMVPRPGLRERHALKVAQRHGVQLDLWA